MAKETENKFENKFNHLRTYHLVSISPSSAVDTGGSEVWMPLPLLKLVKKRDGHHAGSQVLCVIRTPLRQIAGSATEVSYPQML